MINQQDNYWRILHIDDDCDDHTLVRTMLSNSRGRNVVVEWASSYEEGRRMMSGNSYQAVLVDYDLGEANGIELIREFAALDYAAPLILLTGRGSFEVDVEAIRAGATLYLTKAEINPLLLERAIRYAIERKQAERDLRERDHKLSVALEAAQLGAWVYIFEDQQFEMDERAQRLHGLKQPRVAFDTIVDNALHPEDAEPLRVALRSAADPAGEGKFQLEYRVRLPNGAYGWLNAWGLAAFEGQGDQRQAVRLTGASRDVTSEKQVRQELLQNERRFRELAGVLELERGKLAAAIAHLPVGIGIAGPDGNTLSMNSEGLRLHGFASEAEMFSDLEKYLDDFELSDPVGRAMPVDAWPASRALRGDFVRDFEVRLHNKKKGTDFLVSYSAIPINNSAGELLLIVYVFRDMTGAAQAEVGLRELALIETNLGLESSNSKLRESEARFRQLADAMPHLVWTAQPDGTVDYYNQRFRLYTGIESAREAGWALTPVLHPEDAQLTMAAWEEAVRTGSVYQIEHRVRMGDGSYRWHLSRGIPTFDDAGRLVKWYGTATDIDDLKQAEQLLRYREQRMRRLFEGNIIGIVSRDTSGRILEGNDAFWQLTGYSRADLAEKQLNIADITPPEYHALDQQCTQEVLSRGFFKPYEKEYLCKDGRRIPVLIGYTRQEVGQTELIGFVLDLSELKRAQAELADYVEKLKHSNENLEHFAFVASHDLQEPLRKIMMFGSRLQRELEGQMTAEAEDYLGRMQNAAERMRAMINGLLELSRVSTRESRREPVNLTQLAVEAVSDLEPRTQSTNGQVIIDTLPTVEGDALQLRRLLQNLIGNALKFHRPGVPPVVRVTGGLVRGERGPLANIVVEDNGVGFDQAGAEQLFQPFVRLHGRNAFEGSGMGLAICRKIVERHGGVILASGHPGQGSRFTVILPVRL